MYLATQKAGEVKPKNLYLFFVNDVLPKLDPNERLGMKIATTTVRRWLRKLGYEVHHTKKGVYLDGHERPDVIESRKKFLEKMAEYERYLIFLGIQPTRYNA